MKKIKRRPVFDVLDNEPVWCALDAIFGLGGWNVPGNRGGQILFNYPRPGPWVLPDAWHIDCGFERATWPVFAVKAFAFFGTVEPCGGSAHAWRWTRSWGRLPRSGENGNSEARWRCFGRSS